MGFNLKRVVPVYEDNRGVCVWQMPDGSVFGDDDGNILSLEGEVYDPVVEIKMRKAAIYWGGEEAKAGRSKWLRGTRKISDEEYELQNERLLEGHIPDPADEAGQIEK